MKYFFLVTFVAMSTALTTSATASALCSPNSKTLFSCVAKKTGKRIELCDAGRTIDYSFGHPKDKPELALSIPRSQAFTTQWAGVGRYESYTVVVPNGNTAYTLYSSRDRLDSNVGIDAGVRVEVGGKVVAVVQCNEKSLVDNLEGVKLKGSD